MQSVLPNTRLRVEFLPADGEVAEIERLTHAALATRQPEGFVMMRASLEAQRALAACGLPVVLSGTPYPSVRGLPWMDRDHRQVGRLLAGHLLDKGARWILVLMRERMQQGDYLVLDAVRDALMEAGLPGNALTLHLPAARRGSDGLPRWRASWNRGASVAASSAAAVRWPRRPAQGAGQRGGLAVSPSSLSVIFLGHAPPQPRFRMFARCSSRKNGANASADYCCDRPAVKRCIPIMKSSPWSWCCRSTATRWDCGPDF